MAGTRSKLPILLIAVFLAVVFFIPIPFLNNPKFFIIDLIRLPLRLATNSFNDFFAIINYRRLSKENRLLKEKLNFITTQLVQLREAQQENERLNALFSFKKKMQFATMPVKVIGKDSSNWTNTLILDKGKLDGIVVDTPVVSSAGLVGKIIETGQKSSRAILLTDPNSRVSVIVQRTREEGILYGLGRNLCRLRYLPVGAEVKSGDFVVSSGFGGVYPKGLLVGTVVKVGVEDDGLSSYAIIKPQVELEKIEEAFCLK